MSEETELKLAVPPRIAARVLREPAIAGAARGRPVRTPLTAVYYDTPERALEAARIGLRVRREGQRWVQTAKWAGSARGGLHARGELECEITGQHLELDRLAHPALDPLLGDARLRERLRPVFVTQFDRAAVMVDAGGAAIEVALDRGHVVAGTAREAICELELELKSGEPGALFALARALCTSLPLRPLARSKAERGFRLARGQAKDPPLKAVATGLDPAMDVGDALAAILGACLGQLEANEAGMLEGRDPEYLHQMRVALRRMRSCLATFRDVLPREAFAPVDAELKWLAGRLGPARDWDVFCTELLPPLLGRVQDDAGLAALAAGAETRRAGANRTARAAVRSRRYALLALAIGERVAERGWRDGASGLDGPVLPYAASRLARRRARALKLGRDIDSATVPELHELRIALKKLRYAAEFFGPLYAGRRARAFRNRLAELQDALGAINDAGAMERSAAVALPGEPLVQAFVTGWGERMIHEGIEHVHALWRGFRKARAYW